MVDDALMSYIWMHTCTCVVHTHFNPSSYFSFGTEPGAFTRLSAASESLDESRAWTCSHIPTNDFWCQVHHGSRGTTMLDVRRRPMLITFLTIRKNDGHGRRH
jgi:hypothetical protein